MTVGFIQQSGFLFKEINFGLIYVYIYICLMLNYYFTFKLYDKYGIHKLEKINYNFNVKSFNKYLCFYLFQEHKFGLICIFWIFQLAGNSVVAFILNNETYEIEKLVKVALFFTKYGNWANMSFIILHAIIYILLYLTILCKLNGSCLCMVTANIIGSDCYESVQVSELVQNKSSLETKTEDNKVNNKENQEIKAPEIEIKIKEIPETLSIKTNYNLKEKNKVTSLNLDTPENQNPDSTNNLKKQQLEYKFTKKKYLNSSEIRYVKQIQFIERMLEMFKFLKIFDYDKELGDGDKILKNI